MRGVVIFLSVAVVIVALTLALLPGVIDRRLHRLERAGAPDAGVSAERREPKDRAVTSTRAARSPPEPAILDVAGAEARRRAALRAQTTSAAAAREKPAELPPLPSSENPALIGLEVTDTDSAELERLKVPKGETGVIVKAIDPSASAVEAGLHEGDVIVRAQRDKVTSTDSLRRSIGTRDYTVLTIYREGRPFQVVLQKPYQGGR